jgi:hypothetical protein
VPDFLSKVVTPTHVLTNEQGVILQIWFGSDRDAGIRKRMSRQISSDLLLINDVLKATENQNK